MKFAADFETTTDPKNCFVWAYALCEIGNPDNFIYGNSLDAFMDYCESSETNLILYFHNLKFDGEFILSWLFNNNFKLITSKKERQSKTFSTLISDMGAFYSIEIYFDLSNPKKPKKLTIYDSLKILNFSVEKIAKDFNLPIRKLTLDYKAKRERNHTLTENEINYIRNDVEIMARALKIMFDQNLTKITIASDAMDNYKKINLNFRKYFPLLPIEIDQELRKSYKGGFTYLNPLYKEKTTRAGIVLDVNSLYPSVMMHDLLPFGSPIYYEGKYEEDKLYPLYIQMITCSFKIKENMIPTIQIKNSLSFLPNEYLESSNDDLVTLVLTSIDLELFQKHYDIYDLSYNGGYKFKGISGLFSEYINYWSNQKIEAKQNNNGALYQISKLMLNSLYGKFGLNPITRSKIPFMNEEGIIKFKYSDKEERESIYVPIAAFITSYARRKTIEASQAIRNYSLLTYNEDRYIYSDTDSIHCLFTDETELLQILEIDDYKLGAWKKESEFIKGRYLRQKCYIELGYDNKLNTTIAGLPKKLSHLINFDNFNIGFSTEGIKTTDKKLTYVHVPGGVILAETDFTIK